MLTNVLNSDNYYILLKSLPVKEKLELINRISISIKDDLDKKDNKFYNCFGKLNTNQSADELIDNIYKSRYFSNKEIVL